jgi:hypothetical protein
MFALRQSGVGLTDGVRRSSERREANARPMTSAALQAVKGHTTRRLIKRERRGGWIHTSRVQPRLRGEYQELANRPQINRSQDSSDQ